MRIGKCQDRSVGRNQRGSVFGVPGLYQIGERHDLEVPPWDLWRPLGIGKLAGLLPLNPPT